MNWKLLTTCILTLLAGFVAFSAFTLWRNGTIISIPGFITYITTSTTTLFTGGIAFLLEKWQLVIGSIGGTIAVVGTIYKAVSNKINAVKQDTQTQLASAQTQMGELQDTITDQEEELKQVKAQIKDQAEIEADLKTTQEQLMESNHQVKTLRSEVTTLERMGNIDYVRKLQEQLKANNIPLPPYEGTTVTVVK